MNNMFNAFLSITIWSSIIIVAILIIRRLFSQKISASFFRLAWLCLAIRLILPFDTSLPTAPITLEVPSALYIASSPSPTIIVSNSKQTTLNSTASAINGTQDMPKGTTPAPLISEFKTPTKQADTFNILSAIKNALPIIWLMVALIYFTTNLTSYLIFAARLRKSRQNASDELNALCDTLDIYASPLVSSPILCGYLRPTIYVPFKEYTQQEAENIVAHELMHYKHGDLWAQLLLLGAVSISWANPLVHIMHRKAICDIEMNVDEKLLSQASREQRLQYGKMLFAEISTKEGLLLAQYNSGKSVKERFNAIITTTTKSRGRLLLCAILTTCIGTSLLVSCVPKPVSASTPPDPTISTPAPSQVTPQSDSTSQQASPSQSKVVTEPQNAASSSSQNSADGSEFFSPIKKAFTIVRGPSTGHENSFDFAAPKDTPIHAVLDGVVTIAWTYGDETFTDTDYSSKNWAFGNHLIIDHGNGLQTLYAHCTEIKVKSGDNIKAGDVIATVGSTGNTTGNHLHLNFSTLDKEVLLKVLSEQGAEIIDEFVYKYENAENFTEWDEYVKEAQNSEEYVKNDKKAE